VSKTDFYNWNSYRAYPLLEYSSYSFGGGVFELPESILLDAGFTLGLLEEPDPSSKMALYAIEKGTELITFYFKGEGALGEFVFNCTVTGPGTFTTASTIGVHGGGEAFVVVPDLSELYNAMPAGLHNADGEYLIEPGLVHYMKNAYVNSLNTASEKDDPGTDMCATEGNARWDFAVTGRALVGHQLFKPGYNAYVSTSQDFNTLEIGAGLGNGEGEACGRIDLEDYGESSSSTIAYEPILTCADGINTINGVTPTSEGSFRLTAGAGIDIIPYPDEHRVVISFRSGADSPFCGV